MNGVDTHTVTFQRLGDGTTYTIGTYPKKLAKKIASSLASRTDVRTISVRAVWEK